MGNESSFLSGLRVDYEKAIEVNEYWIHYSASYAKSDYGQPQNVSLFATERQLTDDFDPIKSSSKYLMLYRHPCILRYISSWEKGSNRYLAVEGVSPLSQVLSNQSTLKVCIGLYSILKALIFLHEANVSHNNVCIANIYVTPDGSWKLGGFEFLRKFDEVTKEYLDSIKKHRYSEAIDSNEEKHLSNRDTYRGIIDGYAFAVLAQEVLKSRIDENIPGLKVFYNFCKSEMQSRDITKRPKLTEVIHQAFFSHEFVNIYSFLNELPLKTETEKSIFFSSLVDKLQLFPEDLVAEKLGNLLLSRMVLLDTTARKAVLPILLRPKGNEDDQESFFSENTFKKYLVPKLLQIFKVTDLQVRELLLSHFNSFATCFTKVQLKDNILPELLLGIKDKNDNLVAMTLRSLADLVPILGSETVIGGKRAKLFSDGRPITHFDTKTSSLRLTPHKITEIHSLPVLLENEETETISEDSPEPNLVCLQERPSPDGGEDSATEDVPEVIPSEDLDWSDWDIQDTTTTISTPPGEEETLKPVTISKIPENVKQIVIKDISELDIKCQSASKKDSSEIDFFQDMEPVINCSNQFVVNDLVKVKSVLDYDIDNVNLQSVNEEEGWSEDLDWNIDS